VQRPDPTTGEQLLTIEPDGIHALEQFVLAKYYITTQVVRHRIRLITDQMLIRAITLGVDEDEIEELRTLYAFDGTHDFIRRYAAWGDSRLLQTFSDARFERKLSQFLFRGLLTRQLLKLVFKQPIIMFPPAARELFNAISKSVNSAKRRELESLLSKKIGEHARMRSTPGSDPSRFVILYAYALKSVQCKPESRIMSGPFANFWKRHDQPAFS